MNYQVSQTFDSFEEFNSFPHGWDTDFRVHARKSYQARIEHSAGEGVFINTATYSQSTLQRGSSPDGMRTFALAVNLEGPMMWRDCPIDSSSLMLFPNNRELFAVAQGASQISTFSVSEHFAAQIQDGLQMSGPGKLQNGRVVSLEPTQKRKLLHQLATYTEFLSRYGDNNQHPDLSTCLQADLTASLLQQFSDNITTSSAIAVDTAAQHVRSALAYIHENRRDALTVFALIDATGINRRVLELSFRKYVGMSPKQFIKRYRLMACRADIESADPRSRTVSELATGWGFWHLGQFGSDFKALFGETPSSALGRRAKAR